MPYNNDLKLRDPVFATVTIVLSNIQVSVLSLFTTIKYQCEKRWQQSSAVIRWFKILKYCVNKYRNWCRLSVKAWTDRSKRTSCGVSFVNICGKIDRVITAPRCIRFYVCLAINQSPYVSRFGLHCDFSPTELPKLIDISICQFVIPLNPPQMYRVKRLDMWYRTVAS